MEELGPIITIVYVPRVATIIQWVLPRAVKDHMPAILASGD
jgi:hypothetical protein